MGVKCFMAHETGRFRTRLRRFTFSSKSDCAGRKNWGHDASSDLIGVVEGIKTSDGYWDLSALEKAHMPPKDDPRWPTKCEACDYVFQPGDEWQLFADQIMVGDDGKEYSKRHPVPGMMWYADWYGDYWKGPDGHTLIAVCPDGHEWIIDGQARNCTMKDDTGPFDQHHRCWVRHGVPPNITVDKNGRTCAAGAGSIDTGKWHGFLRNGEFV